MNREPVTRRLAAYALSPAQEIPRAIIEQAQRAFLNYTGCALGAVDEPASEHAFAMADEFSGRRTCTVLGRSLRLDAQHAALVNCLQSSIQTFDDTHLSTVIHPTGPVAAALFALIEHRPGLALSGRDFLSALALGVEVSCRVAVALTAPPARGHVGVFATGFTAAIGAAAACGRVIALSEQRMAWALGLATAQACGMRAIHATMSGGLLPGVGARAGLSAALLAERGFDGSEQAIEGKNGLLEVFAPGGDASLATAQLGERFEMAELSYKPYPCGIVIHPAIDACLGLAGAAGRAPVEKLFIRVNPLALTLAGTRHPADAMGCKVSLHHWCAAALARRVAGPAEGSDAAVRDPAIVALRERIEAVADERIAREEADAQLQLADGRSLNVHVPHARGSRQRPLTGDELGIKFLALAEPRLGIARARELLGNCETLSQRGPDWLPAFAALVVPERP